MTSAERELLKERIAALLREDPLLTARELWEAIGGDPGIAFSTFQSTYVVAVRKRLGIDGREAAAQRREGDDGDPVAPPEESGVSEPQGERTPAASRAEKDASDAPAPPAEGDDLRDLVSSCALSVIRESVMDSAKNEFARRVTNGVLGRIGEGEV